jgi:hypothetical protein
VWVVFSKIILDLLHHFEEIFEADQVWIGFSLWPDLREELLGFFRIPLQRLHDGFQVFDVNGSYLLFVEEVEDLFQVLDFFFRKLQSLLTVGINVLLLFESFFLSFNGTAIIILLLQLWLIHLSNF